MITDSLDTSPLTILRNSKPSLKPL